MGLFSYIFASDNTRNIKKLKTIADKIIALDEEYSKLSDDELKHKTIEFKERLKNGETLNDILVEAYATVREASYRVLNMKHFYVHIFTSQKIYHLYVNAKGTNSFPVSLKNLEKNS